VRDHVRITHGSGVRIAVAVLLLGLCSAVMTGCSTGLQSGQPLPAPVSNTPAPAPNSAIDRTDADYLATAVQLPMIGEINWPNEPQGNVPLVYRPGLYYVHISKVTTAPPTITFDAYQLYTGDFASVEASRDKQPDPKNHQYERNAYPFGQTVPVAPTAGAVLQFPLQGQAAYGNDKYAQVTVANFADFASRMTTGTASKWLPWAGYWITVNDKGVQSIVQQHKE